MADVERNDRPWFQVQASIIGSVDLNRLSPLHERIFWRLHALCCKHGIGDTIHGNLADFARTLPFSERVLRAAFAALESPGTDGKPMIEVGHSFVRIVKWYEYQPATTSTERNRVARDRKRVNPRRRGDDSLGDDFATSQRRLCDSIDAEAEAETEREHTHRTAVREGPAVEQAPPDRVCVHGQDQEMPPHRSGKPVLMPSGEAIKKRWDAAMQGLGLRIPYGSGLSGFVTADSLFRSSTSDDEARAVAAYYRSRLKDCDPSPRTFVAEYATRKAQWEASKTAKPVETGGVRRCSTHPGGPYDTRGNCERCAASEAVRA